MEQVILDHLYYGFQIPGIHNINRSNDHSYYEFQIPGVHNISRSNDHSYYEFNKIISLFGLYPNFVFEGTNLISGNSKYTTEPDGEVIKINVEKFKWVFHIINDKLQYYTEFKNNLLHGIDKLWFDNGILLSLMRYRNNLVHGMTEYYSSEGIINRKGNFINGKREGIWEYYYSDGNRMMRGNYEDNERNGEWEYWDCMGKNMNILDYSEEDDEILEYFKRTGEKYFVVNYNHGERVL